MLGTQWISRRGTAERTAQQAWEYLSSGVAAAGDNATWARRRGSRLADEATDRVGSAADEAWQRANAAVDALAGRRARLPWALLLGTGLIGIAVGAVAATATRTFVSRRSSISAAETGRDSESADSTIRYASSSTAPGAATATGTPDIEIVDVEPATAGSTRSSG